MLIIAMYQFSCLIFYSSALKFHIMHTHWQMSLFYSLAAAGSEDISNECNNNVWCRPNRQAMYCSINYAYPSILSSRTTVRGDIYCQMRPYYTAEGDGRPRPPRSVKTSPMSATIMYGADQTGKRCIAQSIMRIPAFYQAERLSVEIFIVKCARTTRLRATGDLALRGPESTPCQCRTEETSCAQCSCHDLHDVIM